MHAHALSLMLISSHMHARTQCNLRYATTLMRPEYRQQIGDAYKRKIEAIVRKPGERTDVEEPETPSPFDTNTRVAETTLECPSTRNQLPYCVATGRHIVLTDLTTCPSCAFPALFSAFTAMIEAEGTCPMCQQEVSLASIRQLEVEEASEWLHGATKKENAGRRWGAGGVAAAVKKGGLGALVSAAKANAQ